MASATTELQIPIPRRTAVSPVFHLTRAVWLESLRRNELWAAAILLGLYAAGALVARMVGAEGEAAARFIRGLGLQLGSTIATVLVIVLAARQVPVDIEQRTIHPLLARPVSRGQYLLGKILPVWTIGLAALGAFVVMTLAATPGIADQQAAVLVSALALKALALGAAAALALWLSLFSPSAVAMLLAGAIALAGPLAANVLEQVLGGGHAARMLAGLLPDLALLDRFHNYVEGSPSPALATLAGLAFYGAGWILLPAMLAWRRFARMSL